jgi:phosphoribosylamine--glycine ligase
MKVLIIGSGGREHALAWKMSQSSKITHLYCSPGNPGIAAFAECLPMRATALDGLLDFARRESVDMTVVGPEQPLADGIVDAFEAMGLKIFGPTRLAAELEWSKVFAKEFMQRHAIPTAAHRAFSEHEMDDARTYLQLVPIPVVVKMDGLAAGKGVAVCTTREQALASLEEFRKQSRTTGNSVVIEECMEGEEASVFAITDGESFITLAPAQDHKRVFDGDRGKNTGGMGAYAPAPVVTDGILRDVEERIIKPTLTGMAAEGRAYKGCLYVGLMITATGPKVVEYNCRFGDPEAQVVLPLYDGDIVELFDAACEKRISALNKERMFGTQAKAAVCVVLASGGYPDQYATGMEINGLDELDGLNNILAFHAGTKEQAGAIVTAGGRVLGITSIKADLPGAIEDAYAAAAKITFAGMHYRRDIGKKAFVH